jgi:GDP-L-fucose synthase
VEDTTEGIIAAAEKFDKPNRINLGARNEVTIKKPIDLIVQYTGFSGQIVWDNTRPMDSPDEASN